MASAEPSPTALRRVSTVAALVTAIREAVLAGQIAPGAHVREVALAEAYAVGRHSVRAAIQTLVGEGLLLHEANRGAFVPVPDVASGEDLYRFRRVLELGALREAHARDASFAAADAAAARLEELPDDVPWSEVAVVHNEIHRGIVDAAGSRRLSAAHAALQAEMQLFVTSIRPVSTVRDLAATHRALVDALRRPYEEAAAALEHDLRAGQESLVAALRLDEHAEAAT